jgi:hypothetical protein
VAFGRFGLLATPHPFKFCHMTCSTRLAFLGVIGLCLACGSNSEAVGTTGAAGAGAGGVGAGGAGGAGGQGGGDVCVPIAVDAPGSFFGMDVGANNTVGLVWQDALTTDNASLQAGVLDANNALAGPVVVAEALAYQPVVAWGHGAFLVAYRADVGGRVARIDPSGALLAAATDNVGDVTDVLAYDAGFALALHNAGPTNIALQRLDPNGELVGSAQAVCEPIGSSEAGGAVTTQGEDFTFFWDDTRTANHDIYHRLIDDQGMPLGAEVVLVDDDKISRFVRAVDVGTATVIAWIDDAIGVRVAKLSPEGAFIAGPILIDDIPTVQSFALAAAPDGVALLLVGPPTGALLDLRNFDLERTSTIPLDTQPNVQNAALVHDTNGYVAAWRRGAKIIVERACALGQ